MSKNILHISDLHLALFKTIGSEIKSRFEETNFKAKFINKVKSSGYKLDYIFVTGDLANSGKMDEYKLVTDFLVSLSEAFSVDKKNIIICPGNHDVNWVKNQIAYSESLIEALSTGNPAPLESSAFTFQIEKFIDFKTFYDNFYDNDAIKFNPSSSIFRKVSLDVDDLYIELCCINSCYHESFSDSNHYGYINHEDFEQSLTDASVYRIALLHHVPIVLNDPKSIKNWDIDIKYLCNQFKIKTFIFGHQHKSQSITIGERKNVYVELSVGSLGKNEENCENTFNILSLSKKNGGTLQIIKNPYQYIKHEGEYNWELLVDKNDTIDVVYTDNNDDILIEPKELLSDENDINYPFPEVIESFSNKLLGLVKSLRLFSSGHFHWNSNTRTLGFIDTFTLVSKRESALVAKGAILELYKTNCINSEFIIGLGQEGSVLGAFLAITTGLPFSFIPYHSRRADHSKQEWDLNLSNIKNVTLIVDVICSASSIKNMLTEKSDVFKEVEVINLFSLFHISNKHKYSPDMFSSKDKRIKYYTVCDKIIIDECKYADDKIKSCPIIVNKLEKVHSFHSKS